MPLDYPSSPALNEEYTFNGKTWRWDGTAWLVKSSTNLIITASLLNNFQYAEFTANGSGTTFDLNFNPPSANAVIVFVNGVIQEPIENYSIAGDVLVFTSAPEGNANVSVRSLISEGNSVTIGTTVTLATGNVQFDSAVITGNLQANVYVDASNRRLLIKNAAGVVVWGD